MAGGYRILEVSSRGLKTLAVLPLPHVNGFECARMLRQDYFRLAESADECVELDLRQVQFIDNMFFSGLLVLRKGLHERSIRLEVRVSASLKEVIDLLGLNQLLGVIEDPES